MQRCETILLMPRKRLQHEYGVCHLMRLEIGNKTYARPSPSFTDCNRIKARTRTDSKMQTRLQTMQTQQMQRTPAAVTYVSRKSGMPATQGTTTATGYTYGKAASAFKVKAQAKAKARAKTKTYPKLFQGVPVQPPQQPVQAF